MHHPAMHHLHRSDQGFSDFDALNFNPTNGTFDPTANYANPDMVSFAGPQNPFRQTSMDETSLIDLHRIAKELEGVKRR